MTGVVGPPDDAAAADLELDCRGMRCPRPVIELARHLGDVAVGGLVRLLADDPAAGPDVAAWCRMRGHTLARSAPPEFWVRRDS